MFVRAFLRASTAEQDAHRARARLDAFAQGRGLLVAARSIENESEAKLARPELFRLLADCEPDDVHLTEQVHRLSRLSEPDWRQLRAEIEAKQVRIVALDLPTSWSLAVPADDFTARMLAAVDAMMLDPLAAVAQVLRGPPPAPGRGHSQGEGGRHPQEPARERGPERGHRYHAADRLILASISRTPSAAARA